jgi:hypothetical protein
MPALMFWSASPALARAMRETPGMTREEIERGLADSTLERGVTVRYAKGAGDPPTQGSLLLPSQVDSVNPPVHGREVVGWLVVGEVTFATVAQLRWMAPVVGMGRRR